MIKALDSLESRCVASRRLPRTFAADAAAVFILALILRLLFFGISSSHPVERQQVEDSRGYLMLAQNMNQGLGFGRYLPMNPGQPEVWVPELCRTPGYPWLIAASARDVMADGVRVLWLQHLMGLAICGAGFTLCYLGLGRIPGVVAGLMLAVDIQGIALANIFLTETVFTLLLLAAALSASKLMGQRGLLWAAITGSLLASSILVRPTTLYLPLIIAVVLVTCAICQRRYLLCATALLVLGIGYAPAVAWMARNRSQCGEFTLSSVSRDSFLSYHAALTLEKAKGISNAAALKEICSHIGLERSRVRFSALSGEENSRITGITRQLIRDYPGAFASQFLKRTGNQMLGPEKLTLQVLGLPAVSFGVLEKNDSAPQRNNSWLGAFLLAFEVLMTLAVYAGVAWSFFLVLRRRSFPAWVWTSFWFAAYTLAISSATCVGDPRYRWPAMPLLIIVAAAALAPRSPTSSVPDPVGR